MLHKYLRLAGNALLLAIFTMSPVAYAADPLPLNKAEFILEGSGVAPGNTIVDTNGNGTFLSVWYKGNEIWGQYSERGNLINSEFPIADISNSIDTNSTLAMKMNSNGDAVVAWAGTDQKLYAQIVPAGSTDDNLTRAPFVISKTSDGAETKKTTCAAQYLLSDPWQDFSIRFSSPDIFSVWFIMSSNPYAFISSVFDMNGNHMAGYQGQNSGITTLGVSEELRYFMSMFPRNLTQSTFGSSKQWRSSTPYANYAPWQTQNACTLFNGEHATNSKGTSVKVFINNQNVYAYRVNAEGAMIDANPILLGDAYYDIKENSSYVKYLRTTHKPFELSVVIDEDDNFAVTWLSLETRQNTKQLKIDGFASYLYRWDFNTVLNAQAVVNNTLVYPQKKQIYIFNALVGSTLRKKPSTIISGLQMAVNSNGEVVVVWSENKFNPKQEHDGNMGVVVSEIKARKYDISMKPTSPVISVAKPGNITGETTGYFTVHRPAVAIDDAGSFQVNWEKLSYPNDVKATKAMARFFPGKGVK